MNRIMSVAESALCFTANRLGPDIGFSYLGIGKSVVQTMSGVGELLVMLVASYCHETVQDWIIVKTPTRVM